MLENLKKEMSRFTSPTGLIHSPKDVNDYDISTVLYLHFWRLLADQGKLVDPMDYDIDTDAAYDFYTDQIFFASGSVLSPRQSIAVGTWNGKKANYALRVNEKNRLPLYSRSYLKRRGYNETSWFDDFKWILGVLINQEKEHDIPLFLTLSTMKKETGLFAKLGVKYLTKRLTERYGDVWGIYKDHFGEEFPLKKYTEGAKF